MQSRLRPMASAALEPISPSLVNTPNRPFAYLCLALSMSLVGSYVALSKPLAAVLPVLLLAWMRFGIGGVAMLHWLKKPADEPPLTPQTRRLLFLESFLGNFLPAARTGLDGAHGQTTYCWLRAFDSSLAVISTIGITRSYAMRV
eukprot:gene27044-48538_t